MRVVLDTNVLISAVFWAGKPKEVLNVVRRGHVVFVTSGPLLDELRSVLVDKQKPFALDEKQAEIFLEHLGDFAEIIQPTSKLSVCMDEPDNRVLECALDGHADFVVTGDKDLLVLGLFEGTRIVSVSGFLDIVKKGNGP